MATTTNKSLWAKAIGAVFALAMVLAVSVSLTSCGDPTDKLTSADYVTTIKDLPSGDDIDDWKNFIASDTVIQTDPKAHDLADAYVATIQPMIGEKNRQGGEIQIFDSLVPGTFNSASEAISSKRRLVLVIFCVL